MPTLHVKCEHCGLEVTVAVTGQTNYKVTDEINKYAKCSHINKVQRKGIVPNSILLAACPYLLAATRTALREHTGHSE
jgi:hypothetical protein